jgi:hypothetical protein
MTGWQDVALRHQQMDALAGLIKSHRIALEPGFSAMKRGFLLAAWTLAFGLSLFTAPIGDCAETNNAAGAAVPKASSLQLQELLEVLRAHLAGMTPEELNRAAVTGLLEQLAPRVALIGENANPPDKDTPRSGPALTTAIFDRAYAYIRLTRIGADTAREFAAAWDRLNATNKMRGLILDLRFSAEGEYSGAVGVADRFFGSAQDLVDWGEGMKRTTSKSNFITLPTTVLVNRKTSGAAEVLAGILRHGEAALLVGTNTAGEAGVSRHFTLKTGHQLRVAVAPVKVLQNEELPFSGIKPDIEVMVDEDEERLSMADAYRQVKSNHLAGAGSPDQALTSTNNRPRRRMNEADLVRMAREGLDPRDPTNQLQTSARHAEPPVPQVTDPALARALDILKGMAVVHRFRGP